MYCNESKADQIICTIEYVHATNSSSCISSSSRHHKFTPCRCRWLRCLSHTPQRGLFGHVQMGLPDNLK